MNNEDDSRPEKDPQGLTRSFGATTSHEWTGKPQPTLGGEVRTTSSTGGEKGVKPERFSLLPTGALAKIASHYAIGAEKYDEHNWRKGYEWSKSYDALQRHLSAWWGGEDIDEETGSSHLAAAGFHILTLLTFIDEQEKFDDRYKPEPKNMIDSPSLTKGFASGGFVSGIAPFVPEGRHPLYGSYYTREQVAQVASRFARAAKDIQ